MRIWSDSKTGYVRLTSRLSIINHSLAEPRKLQWQVKRGVIAKSEKDETIVAMRELRNSVAELHKALGLSHVEEARLCTLGVELRDQVAALHNEKEQNLISWARDRRDRDSIIGALELQDASRGTELVRVRSELEAATTVSGARVTSTGETGGCKCNQHQTWVVPQQCQAERGS